ncbi:uncharacterized protein [Fopius arisanus]|uniref:Uncharacterized protein isoform X1 n=1 Tax=Fopius arisanus TaxID=64838 RepID=A0A9R1T0J9_9HYME|nr:PREDICTED: uncharacterized protein LOC105264963 isoform X1 [Fopius arisanus]
MSVEIHVGYSASPLNKKMRKISNTGKDQEVVPSCLDRLQKEALKCLEEFPRKVGDLNGIIKIYTPKTGSVDAETIDRLLGSRSISSGIGEYNVTSAPDFQGRIEKSKFDLTSLTSYCTLSTFERGRNRHGICKRRYYKIHRSRGLVNRRQPGALGQLLAFFTSKLAICTKNMVIAPSLYLVQRIISILFQRRELRSVQCGPSANSSNSLSASVTSLKEDNTAVGNFISVMRPVAVQLISDTTILKRWLQALTTSGCHSSIELTNATRNTETIDCWAYELFFHLKYLQVNRARDADKATDGSGINDDLTHLNLWHRMVQLRDNYIILYEILHGNPQMNCVLHPEFNLE